MHSLRKRLAVFSRQAHSLLPTPIHLLERLSTRLNCRLYCKRDDLTGFGFGGNKTRKLDFLIGEALEQGADTLLAVGANQSNFCRMAAAIGAVHGLAVHLVLGGKKPKRTTGNLLLDHLLGAACHHVASQDWDAWEREAGRIEQHLIASGRKVYRLPIGGSTPRGALGYVEAFAELQEDVQRLKINFDTLVVASSSAGTQAGLVVGQALTGWPGRIIGISVAKPKALQEAAVRSLARQTAQLLGVALPAVRIIVDDDYLGSGYAQHTPECIQAVESWARDAGLFLDYVYTGKAAAGLMDYARTGRIHKGECVVFIHTGGNLELFA